MPTRVSTLAVLLPLLCGCRGGDEPARLAKRYPAVDPSRLPMGYRDRNLVLVSFDALQAAHVGCLGYGRDVTPNLDAFAAEAFLFAEARSVSSWTVPASMTWFTGVYPSEHRMTNKFAVYAPPVQRLANLKDLSPGLATLAEVLRRHGYATGGFTGNAGVSGGFGYEQGFDVYFAEPGRFGGMDRSIPEALAWLRSLRGRKFFLFLHGYDIHGQSTPADGYDYRFVDRGYDGRYTGSEAEQEALREQGLAEGRLSLRDSDVRFWRAVYDEKIRRTDALFGRFLAEFDRLGLTDSTLFVLTSDHGTELYEHGRFDHGFTLYDELVRVPLILRLPGQGAGKVIRDRVGSIDLMPTLLDLLAIHRDDDVRSQLRGTSLVPALRGEPIRRDVYSETDYRQYTYQRSILTPDGRKLIVTLESGRRELYDLNSDPGEARDLATAEPSLADELERRLLDHFASIGHDLRGRSWRVGLNPVYPSQGLAPPPP